MLHQVRPRGRSPLQAFDEEEGKSGGHSLSKDDEVGVNDLRQILQLFHKVHNPAAANVASIPASLQCHAKSAVRPSLYCGAC